tara:strand:- start:970 stop:1647 length:678 start_codon:yes stop_codon:yes gene_type:complete
MLKAKLKTLEYILGYINTHKTVNLFLAGGKSPLILYNKIFNNKNYEFTDVKIHLVDERFISNKSKLSNLNNIKKQFSKRYKYNLYKIKSLKKNKVKKYFFNIKKEKTLAVLGMGEDGHIASIFENSKKFKKLIDIKEKPNFFYTEKIGNPFLRRITMNLSAINLSNKIIIILNNKKKIKKFRYFLHFKGKNLSPINHLINRARNRIYLSVKNKIISLSEFSSAKL